MDVTASVNDLTFRRVAEHLRESDVLGLAALGRDWAGRVGGALRHLTVRSGMPFAAAAAVLAASGAQHLQTLTIVGSFDDAFWQQAAVFLERLLDCFRKCFQSRLRRLNFMTMSFPIGWATELSGNKTVVTGQARAFNACVGIVECSDSLSDLALLKTSLATSVPELQEAVEDFGDLLGSSSAPKSLTCLSLCDCKGTHLVLQRSLSGPLASQLERLKLASSGLRPEDAAVLADAMKRMTRLKVLMLGSNGLGPRGAQLLGPGLLAVGSTLEMLDMSANGLGPEGLEMLEEAFAGLHRLKILNLRGSWTSRHGVDSLLKLLCSVSATIENLDLAANRLGASSVRRLLEQYPRCPVLRRLVLSENNFANSDYATGEGRGLEVLTVGAPLLEELELDGISLGSCPTALSLVACSLPKYLRELSLSASCLEEAGLNILAKKMPEMQELEVLRLIQARMDEKAVEVLSRLVRRFPQLRTLDIRGNRLGKKVVELDEVLRQSPAFEDLLHGLS